MKFLLLTLSFLIASCQQSDFAATESSAYPSMQSAALESSEDKMNSDEEMSIEQMLIKTAYIDFQVNDVEEKHQEVLNAVKTFNAYVVNDRSSTSSDRLRYSMQIRVPKQNFDAFISEVISGVSHVDSKSVSVQDVTEEFVDIQSRLNTKRQLEQRYLQLLEKATNVAEMLQIEQQIGELQEDIESIEGRMNYLQQQVDYSTLNLNFYEKIGIGNQFGDKFNNGFKNGWRNFILFFVGLAHIWPFVLIFTLGMFLLVRYVRKQNRKPKP